MSANYETVLGAGAGALWLVMVHGMWQDRRDFSAQVEAFEDRYRIARRQRHEECRLGLARPNFWHGRNENNDFLDYDGRYSGGIGVLDP